MFRIQIVSRRVSGLHGYDHIAVSTYGECKCVEYYCPTTVDYAWATYSPIEDRSIPENIGIKSLITSSTSGVCDTQLQVSRQTVVIGQIIKGIPFPILQVPVIILGVHIIKTMYILKMNEAMTILFRIWGYVAIIILILIHHNCLKNNMAEPRWGSL